jgi:MYXO-CTERM domain-containing protein
MTTRGLAVTAGLGLAVLLAGARAGADLVRPPPKECTPGSQATSSHSGPYCYPLACKARKDCKEGSCETRRLCIVMKTLGGGRRPRDVPPPVVASVVGSCDRGKCQSGECKTMKVCVSKAKSEHPVEPPFRRAGCGCSTGSPADEAGGALVLLGCALLLAARRRRRRTAR